MIDFTVPRADLEVIARIGDRAAALSAQHNGSCRPSRQFQMDIAATHANGCPLDLQRLLDADDFNFAHDVFGIERHLDRDDASPTGGQLLDFFLPRFAQREHTDAG